MNIDAWIRQPSNLSAIGWIAAGIAAALAQAFAANPTLSAICALVAKVLPAMLIDDHTGLQAKAKAATADLVQAAETRALPAAAPIDVVTLAQAIAAALKPPDPAASPTAPAQPGA